ncbi:hypothetical protein [Kitasatospora kifunensis]|uniref:Uncharacterized protein n=1 Tax=Kitasatospora kifunensis TaxID=58351 RepID=A0A7W7QZ06_KITKI|nr:hypothetical protein [Kitasatospora kifunensis]MBB4922205.1 hypothetical protein [Kitasatospora kifunensis]
MTKDQGEPLYEIRRTPGHAEATMYAWIPDADDNPALEPLGTITPERGGLAVTWRTEPDGPAPTEWVPDELAAFWFLEGARFRAISFQSGWE